MKVLVIPDVHLKPWMFERASEIMQSKVADRAVCLMDIPDDWRMSQRIEAYEETFDSAIRFQKNYPDTLWCYGNHDLSYVWMKEESGFSYDAADTVVKKINELKSVLPDEKQLQYIHKIDKVLFMHGGLTKPFVKYYAADIYEDTDAVICKINSMGCEDLWDNASPIWYRPQYGRESMYKSEELLQVVGHTPVIAAGKCGEHRSVLSCDVFSTYRSGGPLGNQKFPIVDTETKDYSVTDRA